MYIDAESVLLIVTFALIWFWLESMKARDIAIEAGRQAVDRYGLQLLDETVAITRIRAARDANGRLRLLRTYSFEVSDTGADRLSCHLTLLGTRLEQLDIPPHRDIIH
jgi:hypothetical protein